MITIKTNEEIKILREGGKILALILDRLKAEVKHGVTSGDLEELACRLIREVGGRPSFKGYKSRHDTRPFLTALCTSINDEVVHAPALPARKLNSGDIVGIDLGMEYPYGSGARGLYTDIAATVAVGKVSKEVKKLIEVTKKSLDHAIEQVRPGNTLNDIGQAIETYVEAQGFKVVRDLVGHGVGYDVHEEPQIPNYAILGSKMENVILKPGMVLAIEPMVNTGSHQVVASQDGFTIKTKDGSLSAHFEHTVVVIESGRMVITSL